MQLEPLAQHLEDEGVGTQSQNIFVYSMPFTAKSGVALLTDLSGTPIDHELPGYYKASLQVLVRDPDYKTAETKAYEVMAAMTFERKVVGSMSFKYLRPRHLPISFPRSDGDEVEFSINFDACFVVQ